MAPKNLTNLHLPGLGDLLVFELIHEEVRGLARRINDERIAVEAFQHDRILRTQIVCW